jgi:outer membrane protein
MTTTINKHLMKYISFTLGLLLTFMATSQDTKYLTLDQAIEYALEHNVAMKTARADQQIAAKRQWETTAMGLPQVNGSVDYQRFLDIPTQLIPAEFFGGEPGEFAELQFGTKHNLTAGIRVNQLVFDGSYLVGLRTARIYRDLASQQVQRTEVEVRATVAETYLLSLLAKQNLEIVRQNLTNLEKTLFETKKVLEAGFTDAINVDQLQLASANLKNTISTLERQSELAISLLKFQIGMEIKTPIELKDNLEGLMESLSAEAILLVNYDLENHIDYRLMKSQEDMNLMGLKLEQSRFLPSLNGTFVLQQSAQRDKFNFLSSTGSWFPTTLVTLNLNIPIFSSGMRSARVSQKKLELQKAELATWQVRQSIELQMQRALADWKTAQDKNQNQKENLGLAKRILDRTIIMHREGLATSLELTQANDQFLKAQADYLNTLFDLLNAKNNIEKAKGK